MKNYNNFTLSKRYLSALGYALRRLLEFESSWINYFECYDDKAIVGLCIGYDGVALGQVCQRLEQLVDLEPALLPCSVEYKMFFDKLCTIKNEWIIASIIVGISHDLLKSARKIRRNTCSLSDHPTILLLNIVIDVLEQKSALLKKNNWKGEANIPSALEFSTRLSKTSSKEKIPTLLSKPRRPQNLRLEREHVLNISEQRIFGTQEGIARLLHFLLAEIEIPAAEVCARNIAQYGREMPIAFSVDMARQCYDEARHALMVKEIGGFYGVRLGDYGYTNLVWKGYCKGRNLAEKLAIQQVIGEGNALDLTVEHLNKLKNSGHQKACTMYEFLIADETVHCLFGNRWLMHLSHQDRDGYEKIIDDALGRINGRLPGLSPVSVNERKAACYPDWFIQERLGVQFQ